MEMNRPGMLSSIEIWPCVLDWRNVCYMHVTLDEEIESCLLIYTMWVTNQRFVGKFSAFGIHV